MFIDRGTDKEDVVYVYIHTHNETLLSHKTEWNNAVCSNMDGSKDHAKWSKSDREKRISNDNTHVESNLKKKKYRWVYLQNK